MSTSDSRLDSNADSDSSPTGPRTESPDNDSAFSDNLSMLSSESSASSGGSGGSGARTEVSKSSSGVGSAASPTSQVRSVEVVQVCSPGFDRSMVIHEGRRRILIIFKGIADVFFLIFPLTINMNYDTSLYPFEYYDSSIFFSYQAFFPQYERVAQKNARRKSALILSLVDSVWNAGQEWFSVLQISIIGQAGHF